MTRQYVVPTHINSFMSLGGGSVGRIIGALAVPASMTWTSNTSIFCPFYFPWPYVVRRMFWINGSAVLSGNSDIGIFTPSGVALWTAGSTANAGTLSVIQYVTVSPVLSVSPGWHYVGYVNSATTNAVVGSALTANQGRPMGLLQQASNLPLASPATFAQYAAIGYPVVGVTNTASGF